MISDDRSANLMFLLALAPLAAGCPGDDTSTSNTTSPDPTTGNTTGDMDSTGGPGPGTGTSNSTTGDMDTTAGPGTNPGTDTGSGDTTDGFDCEPDPKLPTEIDPLCESFVDIQNECYYDGGLPQECIDLYAAYCQYEIEYYTMTSEACGMAWTELLVCITGLTCEQIEMGPEPCMDQIDALDMECGKGSAQQAVLKLRRR